MAIESVTEVEPMFVEKYDFRNRHFSIVLKKDILSTHQYSDARLNIEKFSFKKASTSNMLPMYTLTRDQGDSFCMIYVFERISVK